MAEVIGLDRKPVSQTPPRDPQDLAGRLRDFADRIESGEVATVENWLVVYQVEGASPDLVSTRTFDSDITLSEAVYLLESAKMDLLQMARR